MRLAELIAATSLASATAALAQQPARWRLSEQWRVGGEVEGPHSFGDVRGGGLLPDGRIVIFDAKDQQVHFLSASGQPVRTVGRKGAGPGEYQRANGLTVSPKGDVVVNDPSNNRLTLLAPSGDLVRTIPITNPWGYSYIWDGAFNSRGRIDEYVSVRKPGAASTTPARRVWSADYASIDTIFPGVCPDAPKTSGAEFFYSWQGARGGMTMSVPYLAPRTQIARLSDGSTWTGVYPEYLRIIHTPVGKCDADQRIELRPARVDVPAVERDSQLSRITANAARYGAPPPDLTRVPRQYPAFDAVFTDVAGRVWVERHRSPTARYFEVFSARGVIVAEVESPVTFQGYRPFIIGADRVIGFIADADDIVHLASFRIVRGGRGG